MRKYKTKKSASAIGLKDIIKSNKRQFTVLVIVAVIIVVAILGVAAASAQSEYGSSFLVRGDTIKIGLRTDIEGFGQIDEAGDITGFDRDFIDEVLGRMLNGQEKLYEYVPITSQDAGASIKYGETNINLGLLVEGTDRTKGFRTSTPYYTDNIVAVVHGSSKLDKLANMEGGKVGALSMAIVMDDLEEYMEKNKIYTKMEDGKQSVEILRYSDYESAMTDIEHNRVGAVVMPYAIARQFEARGFRILAEPLYEVGYCVMLPTGQAAFTQEMNKVIAQMETDGTMEELRRKWGL
ncbi:transporter substrate-binding domain-containing protein [Christensenellaceae bacterium OttesenSCG-928-K19]|nr:transporter substrate-binding domain-containing protein [Christensenellaceae bacterium OttesenSCG-928-K19]